MAKGDDVVKGFMRELLAAAPKLSTDDALKIEVRLREQWGGTRVYIGKATALGKAQRLGSALAAGAGSLREALATTGLSRRTGYRVLSRKWSIR